MKPLASFAVVMLGAALGLVVLEGIPGAMYGAVLGLIVALLAWGTPEFVMTRTTIPERVAVTCDMCGRSSTHHADDFTGGHLMLTISPSDGLRGDRREADLCNACSAAVAGELERIGLQTREA